MTAGPDLKVKIVRKIEEIPVHDWDKLLPGGVENYYFFKTHDESNLSLYSFFYIIIYDNDTPVGATTCFIMDFPFDIAVTGKLKTVTSFIRNLFPSVLCPRVLICGLLMEQGKLGIASEPEKVIETIYISLERIAAEEKAGIIAFKDFDLSYKSLLDICLKYGFFRINSLPFSVLEINFASFEGYLGTISGDSRSNLRRNLKKADGKVKIELKITNKPDEQELDGIYAIYGQTCEKQKVGLERVPIDFFRNISKNMPAEAKYFMWRIDGKIAAFSLCLVSGDYLNEYYLGFDYSVAYRYHLYFVRFRDLVNWCIENKIKEFEMGPTGYEPKRRLGFNFIPLYIYAKHRNKFLNPVFKIFSNRLLQKLYAFFSKGEKQQPV